MKIIEGYVALVHDPDFGYELHGPARDGCHKFRCNGMQTFSTAEETKTITEGSPRWVKISIAETIEEANQLEGDIIIVNMHQPDLSEVDLYGKRRPGDPGYDGRSDLGECDFNPFSSVKEALHHAGEMERQQHGPSAIASFELRDV